MILGGDRADSRPTIGWRATWSVHSPRGWRTRSAEWRRSLTLWPDPSAAAATARIV